MKNKGFTLVELLLVLVILGIVSAIVIPGIMKSLSESKSDSGESIEKILKENLELYNIDHKSDIWCSENSVSGIEEDNPNGCKESGKVVVPIKNLYEVNPDIDLGECLLQDSNSLVIEKDASGDTFTYIAKIVCGKNLKDNNGDKIVSNLDSANVYYKTK